MTIGQDFYCDSHISSHSRCTHGEFVYSQNIHARKMICCSLFSVFQCVWCFFCFLFCMTETNLLLLSFHKMVKLRLVSFKSSGTVPTWLQRTMTSALEVLILVPAAWHYVQTVLVDADGNGLMEPVGPNHLHKAVRHNLGGKNSNCVNLCSMDVMNMVQNCVL